MNLKKRRANTSDNFNQLACPANWLDRPIEIILIGAGGTGSNVFDALSQLHHGLLGVDHPHGLHVTVFDGDTVDVPNIGRQRFVHADLKRNKATVLVNRYNLAYGLNWLAVPQRFDASNYFRENDNPDLLITCVDTPTTRAEIGKFGSDYFYDSEDCNPLWLDMGNGRSTGQVILGHLYNQRNKLPNVFDLYPELDNMTDDNTPSCSLAEAIRSQDLYINRTLADTSINILWQLLRSGAIDYHGLFLDTATSTMRPLKINRDIWSFMGYNQTATAE